MSRVFLTGATGFLGRVILEQLVATGYDVTALTRSEAGARAVRGAGARPVHGTMADSPLMTELARASDGVIHCAASREAPAGSLDVGFVRAMIGALEGEGKPYIHSGGAWVFGSGRGITERTPYRPPAATAWRVPIEIAVRESNVRSTIIAPGLIHDDDGRGLISILRADSTGTVRLVGDGSQHWTTVHVADLADLYLRAFAAAGDDSYYLGVAACYTVRELAEAAAGGRQVIAESPVEAEQRLGASLASGLLLDQVTAASSAITDLGWIPSGTSAVTALGVTN